MLSEEALTNRKSKALDCWTHGLAHLIDAYGCDRALKIAARGVLAIADNRADLDHGLVVAAPSGVAAQTRR